MSASLIRSPFALSRSEPSRICSPSHRIVLAPTFHGRRSALSSKIDQAQARGQSIIVHAEPAQAATDAGGTLDQLPKRATGIIFIEAFDTATGKMCHSEVCL